MNIQEQLYKGSHQQHTVTQLWRHNVPDGILHMNLKFRQFTYTAALLLLLLLMELTEHWTKYTVQQPFPLPTDSVQWKVQWTLCGVGATDWMVAVHNMVIYLFVCGLTACCAVSNWLTAWSRVPLKKLTVSEIVEYSPHIVKTKCSLPCSQQPTTFVYLQPDQSMLHHISWKPIWILSTHLCLVLPNSSSFGFPQPLSIHISSPRYIDLDSLSSTTFGQECRSRSLPLCSLLQSNITSFLSGSNTPIRSPFSNTVIMIRQVSNPC